MRGIRRIAIFAGIAGAVLLARARTKVTPAHNYSSADPFHALVRALTQCHGMAAILAAVEQVFVATFGFPLAIVLPGDNGLCVRRHSFGFAPDDHDLATAALAISSGRAVERGRSCFLPLTTWQGVIGALGFQAKHRIPRQKWATLELFADLTSLGILRARLEDKARHADRLWETGKFQTTLLNSISHNLKTPLASIVGALSTLQENEDVLNPALRRELIDTARDEAERLHRLLQNLLDVSRLEAGALHARMDPCDVQDVIGAALEQLGDTAGNRPMDVIIAPNLPFVRMDFVLIVQILVNLLDNAIKYSPHGTPVAIEARLPENTLEISVSDAGDGIAEGDLMHVFEKFNRAGRTGETGGIGLGLSICKGLIEVHNGSIWAQRRDPRGTTVTFSLPLQRAEKQG